MADSNPESGNSSDDIERNREGGPGVVRIDPSDAEPSEYHVRSSHEEPGAGFVQSVENHGIVVPPIGRIESDELRLIDGVRRAKAAETAEIGEIPVLVRDLDDTEAKVQSLTLNDSGAGVEKKVVNGDRDASLSKVQEHTGENRTEAERRLGMLSDADLIEREMEPVPGVGRKTAEKIADEHTYQDLKDESNEDVQVRTYPIILENIDGIGEMTALAIWRQFEDGGRDV